MDGKLVTEEVDLLFFVEPPKVAGPLRNGCWSGWSLRMATGVAGAVTVPDFFFLVDCIGVLDLPAVSAPLPELVPAPS